MTRGPGQEPQVRKAVALLGPYSSRNLGDTATQMAVIQQLRARRPDLEIVGISPEPSDTFSSLGISAFPLNGVGPTAGRFETCRGLDGEQNEGIAVHLKKWIRSDAMAASLKLLIVSGGGQFDDFWGGPFEHPWAMLRWTALARRHGARVVYAGVGVDRLASPVSRRLAVWGLRLAHRRWFRDCESLNEMRALGLRSSSSVCPDLAFALRHDANVQGRHRPRERFAVLNPVSRRTWSEQPDSRHETYIEGLVRAGAWLLHQGLSVRVACTQPRMDEADARALVSRISTLADGSVALVPTPRVEDYLQTVSGAEVLIGSRLHGVILGLVAGCPTVALSPLPKVDRVMAQAGLQPYCLPLRGFSLTDLLQRVEDAIGKVTQLRSTINAVCSGFRSELDSVFDDIAALA